MEYLQYGKSIKDIMLEYNVLNLVINGIPSILLGDGKLLGTEFGVLNLVINGIPSIPVYDKWSNRFAEVLNLVINGIPSILNNKY